MEILGHKPIQMRLSTMIQEDHLHHCLLFEGPTGLGKSLVATWLATVLLCDEPMVVEGVLQGCDRCYHCLSISRNEHPNLVRVEPDRSMKSPQISIEIARGIVDEVNILPKFKKPRIVLFEEANLLTESASNALLKTFEEPSTPTIFILVVTSANFLLTTVRSRSQKFRFSPVSDTLLQEWLRGQGIPVSQQVLALGQGCPGRILVLLQGEYEVWEQTLRQILEMMDMNLTQMFAKTKQVLEDSEDRNQFFIRFIDILEMVLRDVLVWSSMEDRSRLLWPNFLDTIQKWALKMDDKCISSLHKLLEQAREDMVINVNVRLQLEALVVIFKRATLLGYV